MHTFLPTKNGIMALVFAYMNRWFIKKEIFHIDFFDRESW